MSRSFRRVTFLPEVQRPAAVHLEEEAASLRGSHLDFYADLRSLHYAVYTADLIWRLYDQPI